jgi:hypothetical protein
MNSPKDKDKSDKVKYSPEFQKLMSDLMQMYLLRINGQDIVLFGPMLGWPEEKDIEVESIGFGDLVRVADVIEMLQRMNGQGGEGSVMSKLQ